MCTPGKIIFSPPTGGLKINVLNIVALKGAGFLEDDASSYSNRRKLKRIP
jgi:hypothetical protein